MTTEKAFGEIVTDRRKALGLSRAEAARLWNIPYRTLQDWETGKRTPRGFAHQAILNRILSPST